MKKIFLGVMSAILLLTACETIKPIESPDSLVDDVASVDSVIFTASLGAQSKTYLDYTGYSYKTLWAADDEILIWDAAHLNETRPTTFEFCSIRSGAGTETAEFIGTMEADTYVALYAYNYYYPIEGLPSIKLPMDQYLWYRNGQYNMNDNTYPMMAISNSKNFEFQNPCSILKVSITGNGEYLESVTVSSTNGEPMSGQVVLYDNYGDYELRFVGETEADEVYSWVDFYAGAYLSDEPVDCYIVVPAQYYSGGLDFTILTDEGTMTVSTGSSVTTTRSKYYDVAISYETEERFIPDGVYHVPSSVDLTPENASQYRLVETVHGSRYEKFEFISKDEEYYVAVVSDREISYYAGYSYGFQDFDNGYWCLLWQIESISSSQYYLQSGTTYLFHVVVEASGNNVSYPQLAYLPTTWNVRGSFNNWANTEMSPDEYEFPTYMKFAARDIVFNGIDNSFKFDYSGNWSVYPNQDDPDFGVITNLGLNNYGDGLNFDGYNIPVSTPGVYDIELIWDAPEGDLLDAFSYNLIYKGEVSSLDYSSCQLEIVGPSVRDGAPDYSSWNWGNVLLADNDGYPTYSNGVYTWTWSWVYLYGNDDVMSITSLVPGFKIRTVDYQSSGGISAFDLGSDFLDVANSYTGVGDYYGNLSVTYTYPYDITLTIDVVTGQARIVVL